MQDLYGVGIEYQSGKKDIVIGSESRSMTEQLANIARSKIGQAHATDGIKSVTLVRAREIEWEIVDNQKETK